jgi:hypothetical protein
MEQCSNTMIPIDDFNLVVSRDDEYGLGDGAVKTDKLCTCPKPLLSVWEICGSCRQAMHAMADDGLDYFSSLDSKVDFGKFDIETAPYELIPIVEGIVSKYDAPPCPREIVSYLRERPPNLLNKRLKPHFENFIWHIREKFARCHPIALSIARPLKCKP